MKFSESRVLTLHPAAASRKKNKQSRSTLHCYSFYIINPHRARKQEETNIRARARIKARIHTRAHQLQKKIHAGMQKEATIPRTPATRGCLRNRHIKPPETKAIRKEASSVLPVKTKAERLRAEWEDSNCLHLVRKPYLAPQERTSSQFCTRLLVHVCMLALHGYVPLKPINQKQKGFFNYQ